MGSSIIRRLRSMEGLDLKAISLKPSVRSPTFQSVCCPSLYTGIWLSQKCRSASARESGLVYVLRQCHELADGGKLTARRGSLSASGPSSRMLFCLCSVQSVRECYYRNEAAGNEETRVGVGGMTERCEGSQAKKVERFFARVLSCYLYILDTNAQ